MTRDIRPRLSSAFAAFAVPATVTPKGDASVATSVIWAPAPEPMRGSSFDGSDIVDVRPHLAIRKAHVAALPIGSTIDAPEVAGGVPRTWTVDRLAPGHEADQECWRVIVH